MGEEDICIIYSCIKATKKLAISYLVFLFSIFIAFITICNVISATRKFKTVES